MIGRRRLLASTAGVVAAQVAGPAVAQTKPVLAPGLPAGVATSATLEALPGKKPLIKLAYRPPNYETPMSVFKDVITPNDSFFVRWHLADIPEVDATTWSLKVEGNTPLSLTLDQLKNDFAPAEVVAVCQCSGNRRGLSNPHVPGVEWGYGAMGNARWKGARLKDVLAKAGVPSDTIEVQVDGADKGLLDKTPDFVKSIPLAKALDENTLIAYEMNGAPLPHFNGFPARLVIPGWTGTYWMKALISVKPLNKPDDGFWMKSAYRVPATLFPSAERFTSQEAAASTPITEILVNSIITSHATGDKVKQGTLTIKGIAWDGGHGIQSVEVSTDGGKSWSPAALGSDLGRFSFREWSFTAVPPGAGKLSVMARAGNAIGQAQVAKALFNPAGYHHNVFHHITLDVV
ncbi:molybdopterin-dependent oxidoreductase [Vineibacter terrae]|uniref:molybdopterin-dependent oxidoreductase n=1 Tax=Vineibacter terrae TaxID=2586908 RepID=UPI002E337BBB|nr:molybdopterin-dependent oxidoreductase [Vineibacter terrae]HEX2890010.1 molybdopterin-dependent oxidoreductase [Vineibacter terrae]